MKVLHLNLNYLFKKDHGILTEWSNWSPCEEVIDQNQPNQPLRYLQQRTRDCINQWSPDSNDVSCDPSELNHEERECREEFVGMMCFDANPSHDYTCCSTENPCGFKESDCNSDKHCVGELVCGKDNCHKIWPSLQGYYADYTDCCTFPGKLISLCFFFFSSERI